MTYSSLCHFERKREIYGLREHPFLSDTFVTKSMQKSLGGQKFSIKASDSTGFFQDCHPKNPPKFDDLGYFKECIAISLHTSNK